MLNKKLITTLALSLAGVGLSTSFNVNAQSFADYNYQHNATYDTSTIDDRPWLAEDLDKNGYLDVDEIPFSPYRKYYCGFEGKGFDIDENQRFVFYVPTSYFERSYTKEAYLNLEKQDYYNDVLQVRSLVDEINSKITNRILSKEYDTSEAFIVDGVTYYIFDYNGNGIIDLYNETNGYVANETYDTLYYRDENNNVVRVYQFLERTGPSPYQKQYDEDFGDYWIVKYWNGEEIVEASTRPNKISIDTQRINEYRTRAWNRYLTWYTNASDEALETIKEIQEEASKKQEEYEKFLESIGEMSQTGSGDPKKDAITTLYATEINNYSHTYDIDETCYLAVRNGGGTGAEALNACGEYNATKAVEYLVGNMNDNKSWYEERVTTFASADFQESVKNTFSGFLEWAQELFNKSFGND